MAVIRYSLAALVLVAAGAAEGQNLFVNADLDADPDGWESVCGTPMTYVPVEDEAGCAGSGSLHVPSAPCLGLQGGGAGQCIPVVAGALISATGRVRGASGFAGVAVRYHDTADCSGTPLVELTSPPAAATGDWQTVTYDDTVPDGAVAAALAFGIVNVTPVDADVDAGYAGAAPLLFRDGFDGDEDGATAACRWSGTFR